MGGEVEGGSGGRGWEGRVEDGRGGGGWERRWRMGVEVKGGRGGGGWEGRGGRPGQHLSTFRELLQKLTRPLFFLSSLLTLAEGGEFSPVRSSAREERLGRTDEPARVANEERGPWTHRPQVEETLLQNRPGEPALLLQGNHWRASGVRVGCEGV